MKALLLAATLFLSGCGLIPWHPFGTPLTRVESASERVLGAKDKAGDALVEEVFKTSSAISSAVSGNPQGLSVAQAHSATAKTLAVQIFGSPKVEDESKWADLIARQTSLDSKVRELANAESAKRLSQIAKLSNDLAERESALAEAQAKVLHYAAEKEAIADKFLKVCWVAGILFGLYFLGQALQFVASFNPAFQPAANLVNTFVSPVLHSGFSKARRAVAAASSNA